MLTKMMLHSTKNVAVTDPPLTMLQSTKNTPMTAPAIEENVILATTID